MGKQVWNGQGLAVKKNAKTDLETTDGKENVFQAVLERNKDGVKTTVTIKITQPTSDTAYLKNPLEGFLIGQPYDFHAKTDQTTLVMPIEEAKKKKK